MDKIEPIEKRPYVPAVTTERIRDSIRSSSPWECLHLYLMYPIREIRDLCLGSMEEIARDRHGKRENSPDFERLLRDLILEIIAAHKGYTFNNDSRRLIPILVFMGKAWYGDEDVKSAQRQAANLEFTILLFFNSEVNHVSLNDVAKPVLSRLIETPALYRLTPSAHALAREVLMDIFHLRTVSRSEWINHYTRNEWALAERALRLIKIVGDTSFINIVEELLVLFKAGRILSNKIDDVFFDHEAHTLALKQLLKQLRKKKSTELCSQNVPT